MKFYTNVQVYGKNILYRGVENGKRVARRIEYLPTFFVPSQKKSEYKTLHGESVEPIQPGNISDCREFLDKYKDVDNFKIYGNSRYEYAFLAEEFPEDILWDREHICIAYLDIEVASENGFPEPKEANEEVLAITIKIGKTSHVFGVGEFTPNNEHVKYIKCDGEVQLLHKFIDLWTLYFPDVLTGWNVKFFDVPYLVNRINKILGENEANKLSPWKKVQPRETVIMNRMQITHDIYGICILDYLELYKKYAYTPQESYSLNHVAHSELGEKKLDYSEYDNLHQLYKYDFQKYLEYNIRDVELVEKMNDKGRLIELALTLAYDNKVNYDDVFTQVRMWDAIIYNHLLQNKIVIPQMKKSDKDTQYAGAYVKDPILGAHEYVASFDLNSLYPHLIMQYNISMETLIESTKYSDEMIALSGVSVDSLLEQKHNLSFLSQQNVCITPNKQFFNTKFKGMLGELMQKMYDDRSEYKKLALDAKKKIEQVREDKNQVKYLEKEIARYNNLQLAKKVSLNSAYGALGNQYFRFFDIRIAEAITTAGQLSIRWIENKMNEYLNKTLKTEGVDYVIASDTDSIYLNLGPLVKRVMPKETDKKKIINFLDKVCEQKLQVFIDSSYEELAEYVNAYAQKMIMKRESLADKAIWTAKKRYILNVYNNEGVEYKEPKLKIMGLEAVKSSTPSACKEKIKQAIKVIMNGSEEDMLTFIENFREEFKTLPVEDISFPRSVNSVTEYYDSVNLFKKGTPIHVKGALVYNHIIKTKKLNKKFQSIKNGEKIKFCYLKQPNPYNNNTIAYLNSLPKELEIMEYIDYDLQFEKSFLEPLKIILDCINWKTQRVSSLEDFFS